MLKLLRAGDYRLTVTGKREISPHYLRLSFDGGGLLTDRPLHPTMWIRMWFADGDKLHQPRLHTRRSGPGRRHRRHRVRPARRRGLALGAGGAARRHHRRDGAGQQPHAARAGPAGYVIVGDTASLPAISSLLDAIGDAPARVFVEAGHDDDKDLPVARSADITWVDREDAGQALVEAVSSSAFDASDHFGWVACDNRHHPRGGPRLPRGLPRFRANRLRRRRIGWPSGGQETNTRSSAGAADVVMLEANRRFSSSTGPSRSILASAS